MSGCDPISRITERCMPRRISTPSRSDDVAGGQRMGGYGSSGWNGVDESDLAVPSGQYYVAGADNYTTNSVYWAGISGVSGDSLPYGGWEWRARPRRRFRM
jgi:hypothetical protein